MLKIVDRPSLVRTLEQNHWFGHHLYKDKYLKFFNFVTSTSPSSF